MPVKAGRCNCGVGRQEIATSEGSEKLHRARCARWFDAAPDQRDHNGQRATGGLIVPDQDRPSHKHADAAPGRAQPVVASDDRKRSGQIRAQTVAHVWRGTNGRGGTMPELVVKWSAEEAAVRKITAIVHASDEALADSGQLRSLIDQELNYDLDLEEESQIVAGDGVGQNPLGMLSVAATFAAPAGLPNETRIDRLAIGVAANRAVPTMPPMCDD